jgi:hypothetical protein
LAVVAVAAESLPFSAAFLTYLAADTLDGAFVTPAYMMVLLDVVAAASSIAPAEQWSRVLRFAEFPTQSLRAVYTMALELLALPQPTVATMAVLLSAVTATPTLPRISAATALLHVLPRAWQQALWMLMEQTILVDASLMSPDAAYDPDFPLETPISVLVPSVAAMGLSWTPTAPRVVCALIHGLLIRSTSLLDDLSRLWKTLASGPARAKVWGFLILFMLIKRYRPKKMAFAFGVIDRWRRRRSCCFCVTLVHQF